VIFFYNLFKKIKTIKKIGILSALKITLDKFALRVLRLYFGFHRWHVDAPLSARPYRRTVAEMINNINPFSVVEVGCGLGSILSLIKAKYRHGYDIDSGAVGAARILCHRDILFTVGDISSVRELQFDVLILVNWIHDIDPRQLEDWLIPLLPHIHYVLVDTIDESNPLGYKFSHDFRFFSHLAEPVITKRAANEGRRFILYKVFK
jgi:SAM-dependent methyltransferase